MSIISPWIFYAIDLLSKLFDVCEAILIFVPIGFFLYWFIMSDFSYGEEHENFNQKMKKLLKVVVVVTSIALVGVVAIPSEETMYKMLVAKYVTYENIDKATESIKDGVDYIFEKLDKE